MRQAFAGYYRPSPEEFAALWRDATIALDANVLLNFYRYSEPVRSAFFDALEALEDRLWIPHQAAQEFYENRYAVISDLSQTYARLDTLFKKFANDFQKEANTLQRHPVIPFTELTQAFQAALANLREKTRQHQQDHPDFLQSDAVLDRLTTLLHDKVGLEFPPDKLKQIYKSGEQRYADLIPPGYEDLKGKTGKTAYGDLVMWFQLIDHVSSTGKPLIFVTDDQKQDWWLSVLGKTVGPRPELIQEMRAAASQSFYMYSSERFLQEAGKFRKREVNPQIVNEVEAVKSENARRSAHQLASNQEAFVRHWASLPDSAVARQFMEALREQLKSDLAAIDSEIQSTRQRTAELATTRRRESTSVGEEEILRERLRILAIRVNELRRQFSLLACSTDDDQVTIDSESLQPGDPA